MLKHRSFKHGAVAGGHEVVVYTGSQDKLGRMMAICPNKDDAEAICKALTEAENGQA